MKKMIAFTFSKKLGGSLLALLFCTTVLLANKPTTKKEFVKTIEKSFDITADGKVDLNNRYGQVNVKTWEQNKVEVTVTIKVLSRSEEDAEDTFDRIDIQFSNGDQYVKVLTEIDPSSSSTGWLDWFFSSSSSDDFSIHYDVHMPASNHLTLANKYGNSFVENLKNDADISIKYGNIDMEDINGDLSLDLGYGNAKIGACGNTDCNIKYSNLKIDKTNDLRIESKYSKINVKEGDKIKSYSKYDSYRLGNIQSLRNDGKYDHFDIASVRDIEVDSKYSDIDIEELANSADLVLQHSNVYIASLLDGFESLRLEGEYTDFKIRCHGDFRLEARTEYGDVSYPDNVEVLVENTDYHNTEIELYRGSKNAGLIKARLEHGYLKIR